MLKFEEIQIGSEIPPFTIKLDPKMYKKYNRSIDENNPLHFNEKYAQQLGFRTIVVAGVFTYSFFIRPILNWVKNSTSIKRVRIKYHEPAYIEDQITQGGIVTKKYVKNGMNYVECDLWVENQHKEKLTSGSAIFTIEQ